MRNDRYVIPVRAEYRSVFGGVVHDTSASGQTMFIEPKQVVEQNNRLRQQQIAERREVERILSELSAMLEPHRVEILHNAYVIGHLDFVEAKSHFAKDIKAEVPTINNENVVSLKAARHPLLDSKKAVSNDIFIGAEYQAIVITGPNTGGKTITLKTLGLLQLMGQAGLAIPTDAESQIGVFTEIFADIGDEQSIEQNLSTFSSHMTNIVTILGKIDDKSLVLFDELGAGTDPQEGAALAISILDQVGAIGSYVMATTHYPELKVYGYNRPKTINASMEFDVETLSPTYHLLIGVPGRSNAFEISKRLGLDNHIIEAAHSIMDGESQDLNEMIADLENRRKMAETEFFEARETQEESEKLLRDLKKMYGDFIDEREKQLLAAKKRANEIVAEAQESSEKIIRDLRELQKQAGNSGGVKEHQLIDARTELNNLHQDEASRLAKNKVLKKARQAKTFKVGDDVIVNTYGQRGVLMEKTGNKQWKVQLGILSMNVKEEDMTLVAPEKETKSQVTVRTTQSADGGGVQSHVSTQLDLRGVRYEEAMQELDKYLDAAILAGYSQVTIVHGKGTGAIRNGVTDYLKGHRSVKSFAFAPPNQGGNGATIVTFK
jgi:DNA mismatch repair protein MutS2